MNKTVFKGVFKMGKKEISNEGLKTVVFACILLVVGVLFACSPSFGIKGLSYLIGGSLTVIGLVFSVNSLMKRKLLLTVDGMSGAAIAAFGIMFIARGYASIILDFIPWLMISVGIALIVDAFLRKFARGEGSKLRFAIQLILGALTVAIGFCVKFIDGWAGYSGMVLGIILIAYALFMIVSVVFFNKEYTIKR